MSRLFAVFILQILFTELLHYASCISISKQVFKEWHDKITNKDYTCNALYQSPTKVADLIGISELLVSPAKKCSEENARWDYKIVNYIAKHKKDGKLNGKLTLQIPNRDSKDYTTFNAGLRHKTCLHIRYNDSHEISGHFVESFLVGNVIINFKDGSTPIGITKHSILMSPFRYFNKKTNIFLNMTISDMHTHKIISL